MPRRKMKRMGKGEGKTFEETTQLTSFHEFSPSCVKNAIFTATNDVSFHAAAKKGDGEEAKPPQKKGGEEEMKKVFVSFRL